MSLDESVLDHVEGVVGVSNNTEGERVRAAVIALEQGSERIALTRPCGNHKLAVVDVASMT